MTRLALILAVALGTTAAHAGDDHAHDDHAAETHAEAEHDHDHGAHEGEMHLFEIAGLEVLHPWTRATDGKEALIFMELINDGDAAVSIEGAETDVADTAELVGFRMQGGEGGYEVLPPVPVQPGREMELGPDGMAIRLVGLSEHFEEGHHVGLTLITSAGALDIVVAVEAADAMQHSHAGHAH
jgi:copper(I)-binding protein